MDPTPLLGSPIPDYHTIDTGSSEGMTLSPKLTGRVAAALYFLCGGLVCVASVFLPFPPAASRVGVASVGALAATSGVIIWFLQWDRWNRRASLWLVPLAFGLIAVHNCMTGGDGYLYGVFFVVTMVWTGLAHPPGTSALFSPLLLVAYVVPALVVAHPDVVGPWSAVYVVPTSVLVGETVAWVSAHLRRSEVEFRRGEERFRELFAANPQVMWVYDLETLAFIEVNGAAIESYGYTRDEFMKMTIEDIRAPDETSVGDPLSFERTAVDVSGPWRHQLKDGRVVDVEITSYLMTFSGRPAALVSVQDVTHRKALEEQLRHQAFHDPLTDLANRVLFNDRVAHALSRREQRGANLALLLMDLDRFKTVNDSLGHTVGDQILVAVAERLRTCVRPSDTAARLGGDEFAVLLEDITDVGDAREVAARILSALHEPITLGTKDVFVHASIGIATPATSHLLADELLRNADAAMYAAKAAGRGNFAVFEERMYAAAVRRLELDVELRAAISGEQFVVHYQPEVSVSDGRAVGFEALVRWNHPQRGLVAPGEFMELAEDTGLVMAIDDIVLDAACRQLAEWQRRTAAPVFVAVNLSACKIGQPDLPQRVQSALARSGADPRGLMLEVTESAILTNTELADTALRQLRSLGVKLALDDFGTGYSSLSHLRSFPIDVVKIDRSFVAGLDSTSPTADAGSEDRSVVASIIGLARALGLAVIAEGVETEKQAGVLIELGCEVAQGYLFSRPQTAEALENTFVRDMCQDVEVHATR